MLLQSFLTFIKCTMILRGVGRGWGCKFFAHLVTQSVTASNFVEKGVAVRRCWLLQIPLTSVKKLRPSTLGVGGQTVWLTNSVVGGDGVEVWIFRAIRQINRQCMGRTKNRHMLLQPRVSIYRAAGRKGWYHLRFCVTWAAWILYDLLRPRIIKSTTNKHRTVLIDSKK